ncbi:MAG: ribonuclease III [Firmicutes bacterium]|uniref:Ribonuclease 3 n=1 Tax=Candidatus Onthovivens merdipullorum TaxID=2840889 RepID=A0A9D9GWD6_9BACL|nr:ribonuclease III [Candidatus Onthovivens merdipullorum]
MKDINLFLKEFNIKTNNKEIYEMAFTHSSFNSDANTHHHDYERLEFIGDSVLGFVVASLIYKYHPEMEEGDMTKAKSTLVQSKSLAKLARQFGFNEYIRAGHSLTIEEAKKNNNILEDIFEAVVGAMYEDQGIEFCIDFLTKVFLDEVINYTQEDFKDYKSMLQEAMQAEYRSSVTYKTIDTMGPPHDRTFKVEVSFNGVVLGFGIGKSKKEAEQKAAQDALSKKAV